MPNHIKNRVKIGAYSNPYTGVGVEFHPLGISDKTLVPTLHEAGYLARNSDWNFPSVLSPFWWVYCNFDIGHCLLLDDRPYELLPNHFYLIPDHILFHCLGQQPVRHCWLAFSMPSGVDSSQPVPIVLEPHEQEKALIQGIANHIESHSRCMGEDSLYHQCMALLHLLFSRAGIIWQAPLPSALADLLAFIGLHAHETLSNRRLARQAGMSIATLYRMFQAHMQTTPAHYVTQVRVSKAGSLLEQSELNIDEIAEALGLPNRAYFSRVFKKTTSMSPAAFRKSKAIHYAQLCG